VPKADFWDDHILSDGKTRPGGFSAVSLDDFVGEQQERIRDIESHRLGSLEVHDQFVACGQLEGQLTRLRTLENLSTNLADWRYMSGRL
jgi:hypothetical protein